MNPGPTIRVQAQDFDLQAEIDALAKGRLDIGAVVTFTGLCRDEQGSLTALELEHYPGMAEAEMRRIADLAIERFSLMGLAAIHRFGKIRPGENIVLVIAAAPHRQETGWRRRMPTTGRGRSGARKAPAVLPT